MSTPAQQIEALRREINEHNRRYYVDNDPVISDYDFDMLMKQLEKLEQDYPDLDDPLSPTHRVGSDLTKDFEKVPHIYPMLSLANSYSVDDVDSWMSRVLEAVPGGDVTIVGEMKFDGSGISLIYEHGRLVRAVTRGDGEMGDVVTDNVKTIRSVPLQLSGNDWPERFEIRGEIVMPWASFDRI